MTGLDMAAPLSADALPKLRVSECTISQIVRGVAHFNGGTGRQTGGQPPCAILFPHAALTIPASRCFSRGITSFCSSVSE